MAERLANMTLSAYDTDYSNITSPNDTNTIDDAFAITGMSDEDLRGDISQNPNLYMFQLVQTALFVAVIITGAAKGYLSIYT